MVTRKGMPVRLQFFPKLFPMRVLAIRRCHVRSALKRTDFPVPENGIPIELAGEPTTGIRLAFLECQHDLPPGISPMIAKQLCNALVSKYASLPANSGRVEKSPRTVDLRGGIST